VAVEDRLPSAVATVRAFAERSGAARVVLLLDEGEARPPTLVELSEAGLEVMADGAPATVPEGGTPAALPDIRRAPPSALGVDLDRGELEAPLGTVSHLAEVVLALARTAGGRSVAKVDFPTRDPELPLTIAAREGEPVVLAIADRQFLLPDGIA
jgi:hypothetical protein